MAKLSIKMRDRSFQGSWWYSRRDWLYGSVKKNRLFCWPCLLFHSRKSSTWTFSGYANMHSFTGDCQKHEGSKSHMEAYKQWTVFDSCESVDVLFLRGRREEVERYDKEVRQNRETLINIGEAVLYLAKQELAFRGHDESRTSLNQGNYRELLKVFGKLDSVFDHRLHGRLQAAEKPDSGGSFTGVSPQAQNDLIVNALTVLFRIKLIQKLDNASFLAFKLIKLQIFLSKISSLLSFVWIVAAKWLKGFEIFMS